MTEFLTSVHFLRPHWLWLLPPGVAFLWWLARRRSDGGGWRNVIDPQLLPFLVETVSRRRRRGLLPLLALGGISAVVAIAGPSWHKLPQPVLQKQDALVLVLDLSYSMWAQDTPPSRIDRARRKLLDLLEMRREGQTALIAYAGDAHVVTPLTDDHPTIANLLPALDPGMMPLPGSDPAAAVNTAKQLLASAGILRGHILLVTDDVDDAEATAIRDTLAESGASLSILGIGTREGAPIPLPDGGFLKDGDGAIAMPKLPAAALRSLAGSTGGRYRELSVDSSDLEALLASANTSLDADTREIDRRTDTWADMAHWFALPLLPLLLLAFRRGAVYTLLPLLALLPVGESRADIWNDLWLTQDQQGARALAAGEAEAAAAHFVDPRWRATAAYEAGDYAAAVDGFDDSDSADSWYNRGNALARQGELDAAIAAYRESLEREPGRQDAIENRELVQRLKRQQEQQQQQKQQGQDPGDGGQQDENRSGQDGDANSGDQAPGEQASGESIQQDTGSDAQQPGEESSSQDQGSAATAGDDSREPEGDQAGAAESREQPRASIDTASPLAESLERDQAMQQWLRRVPDDPAGLLREKFRYESRKRQRKGGDRRNDEDVW